MHKCYAMYTKGENMKLRLYMTFIGAYCLSYFLSGNE